ncbi:methionine--tRNA ligase [bacterium]|nr:methionine--tRNA ligase [bacterium]
MERFYVTTAIPYANSAPHIGFAMEVIQADALARYHRLIGDDVYFLTGTDEHGMKIFDTAKELGLTAQEHVDMVAKLNMDLKEQLGLSYDDFIRTTSDRHKIGAKALWMKLFEKGDIYKGKYDGFYCSGCEAYITEKDLVDGKCPIHEKPAIKFSEENYFFKLSKYSKEIERLIESDELLILPKSRKKEFLNVVKEGLTDVSFSRPKEALTWGIEVPNDPNQTMYVWCDALSNYITALDFENNGKLFEKYWPADVHIIGKDILRFHAGIWIGMLLSAGIEIPKAIYVHGFITSGGHKMSKSLHNVVSPVDIAEEYGNEALRYYLLREIPTTDDGDFTIDRFKDLYNSDLANNLGNLVNRVFSMTNRYLDGVVPRKPVENSAFYEKYSAMWEHYHEAIENFNLKKALEEVMLHVDDANKYIEDEKPWVVAKEDKEKLKDILYNLLEMLRHIGGALYPFIPKTSKKILTALGCKLFDGKFADTQLWGNLEEGTKLKKLEHLFPRIEDLKKN